MNRFIPFFLLIAAPFLLWLPASLSAQQQDPFLFVDADLDTVFQQLEDLTGQSVLRPQSIPNIQITFLPNQPLTREEKIVALESLLSLNGISLVELSDKFLKAIPSASIMSESPTLIVGSTLEMNPSEAVYAKIFKLDFLTAEEATSAIQPILGGGGLVSLQKSNWLLVADALTNLQRIESILDQIDRKQTAKEEVRFFQIRNLPAEELQESLESISSGPLSRYFSGNTVITSVERSNQLVVVAHPDSMEMIEQLVKEFDVDVKPLTSSKVFYIRHAVAEEVANVIEELVSNQREKEDDEVTVNREGTREEGPLGSAPNAQGQTTVETSRTTPEAAALAAAAVAKNAGRMQFSQFASLVFDERSNAVIVYGTDSDIEQIGKLIDQIDILLAQVRIEVVIVEVTLDEDQVRGMDVFGIQYNTDGDNTLGLATDSDGTQIPMNIGGLAISALTLSNFSMQTVFNVARGNGDVTVLSAPTVMTTHNREARIIVAETRPIVTGSVISDDSSATRSSVEFKDIGIELTVKPLIAETGVIQMEILQTVENIVSIISDSDNPDLNGQPIIGTREAESFVSVQDQGIIVLGGLQERQRSLTKSKLAILGDLPVLGDWLFTRRTAEVRTRELLIFIKPNVMLAPSEANHDAERLLNNLDEKESVKSYLETGEFDSMNVPRINPDVDAIEPIDAQIEDETGKELKE
ncbi:MAG: secretin N-terminal domain-containing protein [Puniceicoccales bacterium]